MQLEGEKVDKSSWRAKYYALKADKEARAQKSPLWPKAVQLFQLYCCVTGKPDKPRKLTWNAERFDLVRPLLEKHGAEMCVRAIMGRATDHFTAKRANGTTVHYHEWERIFGSKGNGQTCASNFEESCNRAPADWRELAEGAGYEFEVSELGPETQGAPGAGRQTRGAETERTTRRGTG